MKITEIPKKTWIGLIVLMVLVVLAGYFIVQKRHKESQPSHNITGISAQITNVRGDGLITAKGVYAGSDVPADMTGPRDITFKTDGSTVFEKTVLSFPTTKEESEKLGESFSLSQLPRRVETGSLDDLEKLSADSFILINADFPKSIYNQENPIASRVRYMITESKAPQSQE